MATAASFVAHVLDQLAGAKGVTTRKMFGEYALYKDGKVVALICDNQVFVKPTAAGRVYIGSPVELPPFKGAKPSFAIGDSLDERGWLEELINLTAAELPAPKAKTARKKGAGGSRRR